MKMRFTIIAFAIVLVQCGGARGPDLGGLGSGAGSIVNPPVGVTTNESFYVHVFDQGYYPYYLNKSGAAWGTDCAINSGLSSQSITCILDLNEMDIYHAGFPTGHMQIQYNAPATMCSYFNFQPAWYYNFEIGYGPSTIQFNVDEDPTTGVTNSFDCVVDGITYSPCTGAPELVVTDPTDYRCVYDGSKLETPTPNCCFGNYTLTTRTTQNGINPVWKTVSNSWNSSATAIKSCIGGQGYNKWNWYTRNGFPAYKSTYVSGTGINDLYELLPPISGGNAGYNIEVANYYTPALHSHSGYVVARTSTMPYAVDPIDDRNGTNLSAFIANDAYDFRCEDKNHEVINRIRLYIRAWNTYSNFLVYGTSNGATYNPDVTGNEGTDCVGTTGYCEDYIKWDSQTSLSHFSSDLLGPYTAPNRSSYFPSVDY